MAYLNLFLNGFPKALGIILGAESGREHAIYRIQRQLHERYCCGSIG